MLAAIVKGLGGVRAAILAVALVIALAGLGVQTKRLEWAQAKAETQRTVIFNLTAANTLNVSAIASLKAANDKWRSRNLLSQSAIGIVADQLAASERARLQAVNAAANRRAAIYRGNPHADQFATSVVPAALFAELRDLAPNHPARRSD